MTLGMKGLRLNGVCSAALVCAPLLALGGCDFGYNAGYYHGFELGSETRAGDAEPAQAASIEMMSATLAPADPGPAVFTLDADIPDAAHSKSAAPAKVTKVAMATAEAGSTPRRSARTPVGGRTKGAPAAAKTVAPAAAPAQSSSGAASAPAKSVPAVAPFAPLRPGASGGGFIIQVGNTPTHGGGDDDPDDDDTDNGHSGRAKPGHGKSGGKSSSSDQVGEASSKESAPAAKITVVDTLLTSKGQSGQPIGVSLGSPSISKGELVSASLLSGDTRSVASVDVAGVVGVSLLPTSQSKPLDSIAGISVGNTPVVSGGQAPLVSVSALPDLGGVTGLVSPVTGAVRNVAGAVGSVASAPVQTPVASVVNGVGATAGSLVGALTRPLGGH